MFPGLKVLQQDIHQKGILDIKLSNYYNIAYGFSTELWLWQKANWPNALQQMGTVQTPVEDIEEFINIYI